MKWTMSFFLSVITVFIGHAMAEPTGTLPLPPRPTSAVSGTILAKQLDSLPLQKRESKIASEILSGNVPAFLRTFCPVRLNDTDSSRTNNATIFVTPDYLAVGDDADHLRMPMTPIIAQQIADSTGCILPTRKIVDAIHAAAEVKLSPQPLTADAKMTTIPVFVQHNELIRTQRRSFLDSQPLGALVVGLKKDVVLTPRLADTQGKVAIYGWHRTNGVPIQPLHLGHTASWVDYSHGIRLVSQHMLLNGQPTNILSVLADKDLCTLLSDEGVVTQTSYATANPAHTRAPDATERWPKGFKTNKISGELTRELNLPDGVRILINTPDIDFFASNKPVQLVFFALPNGNTIEQTIGKQMQPGDDWHHDIQHIGAQTRFIRSVQTNQNIVIAYLENSLKSWPAWRRTNGNARIPALLDAVRSIFADHHQEIILTGHSGGGSLTFGYLNAVETISNDIKRIAFIDSNYAYETSNHLAKLTSWLKSDDKNNLCVLAYHDSIALLDGKTFVSERGGTWGRSHAMLEDLQREFQLISATNSAGLRSHRTADGTIAFLLKENPEKKILHTVQVDRNGFIHAMLMGTLLENHGYEYFGERAYKDRIQP